MLDDYDDEEGYDDSHAAALLSSLRGREPDDGGDGGDPGAEEEEEFDDDGEEAKQRLQVRLEEYAATLSDKRRAAQAKSVERRMENKQNKKRKRGQRGRFVAAADKEQGEQEGQLGAASSEGQGQPVRRRERKRRRSQQSRVLMRIQRFKSKEAALVAFEEALAVLEPAYKTGKVKALIHTDVERFKSMGLAHKIEDFGRSDLGPYRHRVNCIYMWHNLVVAGEKREDAYRLVGAANGAHYNTVRSWVRGFHANGLKLSRLLSGLHQKTASFLDDEDNQRKATEFVRLNLGQELKTQKQKELVQLLQRERKHTAVLKAKAAAHATAVAATDTQTTTQAESTQTDGGDDGVFCTCRRRVEDEEEGREMIACDTCEGWFHPTCVGLDPTSRTYRFIKRADSYTCPSCVLRTEEESRPDRVDAAEAYAELNGRNPASKSAAAQELEETGLYEGFSGRRFHRWINDVLLKDAIAAGAKPISRRAAYDWLHKLGFRWVQVKKAVYVDGHERPDVVRCFLFWVTAEVKKSKN